MIENITSTMKIVISIIKSIITHIIIFHHYCYQSRSWKRSHLSLLPLRLGTLDVNASLVVENQTGPEHIPIYLVILMGW